MQHVFSRTNMIEKWTWCSTFDSICLFKIFQMLRRRTYLPLPIFYNDFLWFFALTGGASYYQNADPRPMTFRVNYENVISGPDLKNTYMW